MKTRTILGIFAHPDDESMGPGGTLARYAADGHRVAVVTATAGGAGRLHDQRPEDTHKLIEVRRRETQEAAGILGIEFLGFLDWPDGQLERMSVLEIELAFAGLIRREKPDVVITFHGSGISYHPDHRVIALAVTGAFHGAAETQWYRDESIAELPPHRAAKLYHYTVPESVRRLQWPRDIYLSSDEEITTVIDTREFQDTRWKAIQAHASQQDGPPFRLLYDAGMFEKEMFVRVFPSPRPGEAAETDLLEGLRFERRERER